MISQRQPAQRTPHNSLSCRHNESHTVYLQQLVVLLLCALLACASTRRMCCAGFPQCVSQCVLLLTSLVACVTMAAHASSVSRRMTLRSMVEDVVGWEGQTVTRQAAAATAVTAEILHSSMQ